MRETVPQISVVVPIYKVEPYLRQCVDSILAQTLRNIEVILVNDGSPDKCPDIVNEYAAIDVRVVAVHLNNGGYGRAVNTGLSKARGKYIGIIESDDWIEPDMYEKLHGCAEKYGADVVKCGFYMYDSTKPEGEQDRVLPSPLFQAPDGVFAPVDYLPIMVTHPSLWSNLYRADFLKDIRFEETAGASYQDGPFVTEVLARARRMCVLKENKVHYRNEPGQGSSSQQVGKRCWQIPEMLEVGRQKLKALGKYTSMREAWYIFAYYNCVAFLERIAPSYAAEYCRRVRKIFLPLKNDDGFRWLFFSSWQKREVEMFIAGDNPQKVKRTWQCDFPRHVFHWFVANRECFGLCGRSVYSITYEEKAAVHRLLGRVIKIERVEELA